MSLMRDTIAVLMAGGQGERLWPLTRDRAKPAVPFGGIYRIIDITLSNCINSELRRVFVLTQYKALSLNRHIRQGWSPLAGLGEFIEILPPQMRVSTNWYLGTADAVYQNIYSIGSERSSYVVVLSGDHIYKMNYGKMLQQHVDAGADATVATLEVDVNYMLRTPLWPVVPRSSRTVADTAVADVPVVDVHELAAGKLAALLGRQASRDVFDTHRVLREVSFDRRRLRTAFVVYGAFNRRDWRTVAADDVQMSPKEAEQMLLPLLRTWWPLSLVLWGVLELVDLWVRRSSQGRS